MTRRYDFWLTFSWTLTGYESIGGSPIRNSNVPNRTGQTELVKNHWLSQGIKDFLGTASSYWCSTTAITKNPRVLLPKKTTFDITNCWFSQGYKISTCKRYPMLAGARRGQGVAGKSTWRHAMMKDHGNLPWENIGKRRKIPINI